MKDNDKNIRRFIKAQKYKLTKTGKQRLWDKIPTINIGDIPKKRGRKKIPKKYPGIYGNFDWYANYTVRVDGYLVDFFKIPNSTKERFKGSIKAMATPGEPFQEVLGSVINIIKMALEIIEIQTGVKYDLETFLIKEDEDKVLRIGEKMSAALLRHTDENLGKINDRPFIWEEGRVNIKYLDFEPSQAEIRRMREKNLKEKIIWDEKMQKSEEALKSHVEKRAKDAAKAKMSEGLKNLSNDLKKDKAKEAKEQKIEHIKIVDLTKPKKRKKRTKKRSLK